MSSLSKGFNSVKEVVLSLFVSIDDGLPRILRELHVFDNELVQVITQEVSARVTSVPIEDTEETALWPVFDILFCGRLHDIEDNTYPVLIVVPDNSLIRVSRIPHNKAVLPNTALCRFPTGQIHISRVGRWTVTKK
jgi:hypothetical protein